MVTPVHHPSDEFLLDYAAGTLGEPKSLLVATHLSLCAACRARVSLLEDFGGALVERLEGSPLKRISAEDVLARADADSGASTVPPTPGPAAARRMAEIPRPLADYVPDLDAATGWHDLSFGVAALDLPLSRDRTRVRLLRMGGGVVVPRHAHAGDALALILRGRFAADGESFGRGDVLVADETVTHEGWADEREGCVCLSVADERPRFVGVLGLARNLFARF
jgi:putative transcriptional regulator